MAQQITVLNPNRLRNRTEWKDSEEDGKEKVDFNMGKRSIVK